MSVYMAYSHTDFNEHLRVEELLDIPEWFRKILRSSVKMEALRKHTDMEMLLSIREDKFIENETDMYLLLNIPQEKFIEM